MEKRLKAYIAMMGKLDLSGMTGHEKEALRAEILVQIGFFQQERLIHLIVTATLAVLALLSFLGCLAWPGIPMFLLTGLLLVLLVPYIRHYYILENGVQKLYKYYDRIVI